MSTPRFFGFGSLVNTATHSYPNPRPDRAQGWERVWVQAPGRAVTFLSARPAPGSAIDGLVCDVPGGDWAALDVREAGYTRLDVSADVASSGAVAIYGTPKLAPATDAAKPILLSYIDVVMQGFGHWFGEDGVARFCQSTRGWQVPILDDRAEPLYPRAQTLTQAETARVDRHLATLGVRIVPADALGI
ncbi:gamma-glutamylcyclotransferase [Pseudaestuariivita sp.]|uniref:gamma-glutamylcyclotransferase n=1 Tax=Pseudaestuariivita sp. TaxID=2211669 RepID=UPI004058861D